MKLQISQVTKTIRTENSFYLEVSKNHDISSIVEGGLTNNNNGGGEGKDSTFKKEKMQVYHVQEGIKITGHDGKMQFTCWYITLDFLPGYSPTYYRVS